MVAYLLLINHRLRTQYPREFLYWFNIRPFFLFYNSKNSTWWQFFGLILLLYHLKVYFYLSHASAWIVLYLFQIFTYFHSLCLFCKFKSLHFISILVKILFIAIISLLFYFFNHYFLLQFFYILFIVYLHSKFIIDNIKTTFVLRFYGRICYKLHI